MDGCQNHQQRGTSGAEPGRWLHPLGLMLAVAGLEQKLSPPRALVRYEVLQGTGCDCIPSWSGGPCHSLSSVVTGRGKGGSLLTQEEGWEPFRVAR